MEPIFHSNPLAIRLGYDFGTLGGEVGRHPHLVQGIDRSVQVFLPEAHNKDAVAGK
jgi:hypothetical protein